MQRNILVLRLLLPGLLFLSGILQAQILQPVKWSFSTKDLGNCEAELILKATIEKSWHLYSQKPVDDGPVPTSFTFKPNPGYALAGKTQEGKPIKKFEKVFEAELEYYENEAVFKQKVKILSNKEVIITGSLEFMVCDDGRCLPPETIEFEFKVKGSDACGKGGVQLVPVEPDNKNKPDTTGNKTPGETSVRPVGWKFFTKKLSETEYQLDYEAIVDSGWNLPANTVRVKFILPAGIKEGATEQVNPLKRSTKFTVDPKDSTSLDQGKLVIDYTAQKDGKTATLKQEFSQRIELSKAARDGNAAKDQSYWFIFITAFFSGFLALLTPCVFPMIPMTVSFFLKSSKTKAKGISNAITYGISIIVIYVTLGLAISAIFGSDALNALSTNVLFNIFFFFMLIVFAASFLGAFEIVLPSSWVNAADKSSDRGGLIGIFFMATTLALVSFSCTGPIIGTLLVQASQQGGMGPFFGMFGFSLAIALPFTLFAIFPGWLNSMPQSGGWLNSVKVSLGFLELAFAFKFLSNADLVVQAHLLEREVFLALWIIIFTLWGFYLLGKIKLSHDSDLKFLSVPRLLLATLVFSFVAYMVPGLWGAPLKLIAAFPPPQYYSESPYGVNGEAPPNKGLPEHAVYGPHKLVTFHDYHHALKFAQDSGKPLMIDFTGYACVNCRLMEENVWSSPDVLQYLKDSVVIVSLHVDDKTDLPEKERYTSAFDQKKIKTIGNKWSDFQKSKYGSNAQPQYLILDANENTLNGSASYESHGTVELFLPWLKEGVRIFGERKNYREVRPEMVLN